MDISPTFPLLPMELEVQLPPPLNANTAQQAPGGLIESPQSMDYGNFHIEGTAERIRFASATAPTTGTGFFVGNDGTGTYQFRVGDPTGAYIRWTGTQLIIAGIDVMAYAATISLDVTKPHVHSTTTINATGNATINASAAGNAGEEMTIIITNDATSGKVITFGTNFKTTGTITGTVSKSATIKFVSDGSNWYETSRTLAL